MPRSAKEKRTCKVLRQHVIGAPYRRPPLLIAAPTTCPFRKFHPAELPPPSPPSRPSGRSRARVSQALLNSTYAGMPRNADKVSWRLPPNWQAALQRAGAAVGFSIEGLSRKEQ
jgi:hypothetical protein